MEQPTAASPLFELSSPKPGAEPAPGASNGIISELAFCAARRTGIGLKNVNAPNFLTPLVLAPPAEYPLRERSPLL
jgi:hypothetical protein